MALHLLFKKTIKSNFIKNGANGKYKQFQKLQINWDILDQAMSLPDCTDTHDIFFENFSAFQEVLRFALGQANFVR